MSTKSFSEELRGYLSIIVRWAWLIILTTILAGSITYLLCLRITPIYQASALVLIEAPNINPVDYSSLMTSESLARTYAERMTTRPVIEGVIKLLDIKADVDALAKTIKVSPVRDTQLIEVKVESSDRGQAAMIANALVMEFSIKNLAQQSSRYAASKKNLETQLAHLNEQIQTTNNQINQLGTAKENQVELDRLESSLAQYQQTNASLLQLYEQVRLAEAQFTSNVVLEEPASIPTEPISPRTLTNTLLVAVLGLLLGLGIVFLLEALDDSIRSPDQVSRYLGLPLLGLIAHQETKEEKPLTILHPRAPIAEAFRSLRTNVDFALTNQPLRTLLVVSPTPQEGKSTVAVNLAVVLAQNNRRVVLVDADLRRPALHKQLKLPDQRGLGDLFILTQLPPHEPESADSFLQKTEINDLQILTAGKLPPNPAELMGSKKMIEILTWLGKIADVVVIDSSPILAVTDAVVLAPQVGGVILIVKPGATKLDACRQTIEQLQRVGARVLGVVLNDVQLKHWRYFYYRYSGHYLYGEQYGEPEPELHKNGKKVEAKLSDQKQKVHLGK